MTTADRPCEICGATFTVKKYRASKARFCSKRCCGVWHAKTRLPAVVSARMKGNRYRAGKRPSNSFPVGHSPWNKNLKGLRLSPSSEFKRGQLPVNYVVVGTVRTRPDKNGKPRAWVKVAEPNKWKPRAQRAWESAHGPIPCGFVVHHINRDTLDDSPGNLELKSRSEHINEHRGEMQARGPDRDNGRAA